MKPEEQRIAIAEYCGWKKEGSLWICPVTKRGSATDYPPPNYAEDLNAIHEAEETLTDFQRIKHAEHLQDLIGWYCVGYVPDYQRDLKSLSRIAGASAEIRAEAFLRAIGKWPE